MTKKEEAIQNVAVAIFNGDKTKAEKFNKYIIEKYGMKLNGESIESLAKKVCFDPFFNNDLERVFASLILGQGIGIMVSKNVLGYTPY